MHIFSLSRNSSLLAVYGFFAVLCQSVGILFSAATLQNATGTVYFHRYFPMLEHSLVSFIAILVGLIAFEYIDKTGCSI